MSNGCACNQLMLLPSYARLASIPPLEINLPIKGCQRSDVTNSVLVNQKPCNSFKRTCSAHEPNWAFPFADGNNLSL